ncbi:MAG: SdrD B-like domain-containing protein [Caldilineaceae bacterium]
MHPCPFLYLKYARAICARLTAALFCLMAIVFVAPIGSPAALAQGAGPESAITAQHAFSFTGNYCVAYGGVSLMPNENNNMIDLYINGDPVQSYWVWSGRDPKASAAVDNMIVAKRFDGNGGVITIQATSVERADNGDGAYFSYLNDADPVPLNFGYNKITMSGNGHADPHGVGLVVVYESVDRCPNGEQKIYFGADTFTYESSTAPTGPDSEVACVDFAQPVADPHTRRFAFFVAGVAGTSNGSSIWWQTGSGAKPTYLAPDPATNVAQVGVNEIHDPFITNPGREFDIYTADLDVNTGDTWACMQIESPEDELGVRANWIGLTYSEYEPQGSFGNLVWFDYNGNGYVEDGEPGIPNVRMVLSDADGNEIDSTLTDENGYYNFPHLAPAVYTVAVDKSTLPEGAIPTFELDQPDNGLLDSQLTAHVFDPNCHPATDVDFGFKLLGTIGDRVWYDTNGDGVQDGGEVGIPGVTLQLIQRESQVVIATQETVGDGFYTFTDVERGNYIVRVVTSTLPQGYYQSGDADEILDNQSETHLPGGGHIYTMDFGYTNRASLGDYVWHDLNANGVQETDEPGIGSVHVTLYNGGGTKLSETTTNSSGYYRFVNLDAGSYIVEFTAPAGYTYSAKDQGGNDAADSDADAATGRAPLVTLAAGEANLTIDAGLYQVACLGDTVWEDTNNNGIQDEGEPGVELIPVTLYDGDGNVIDTTQTDANGNYQFCDLLPGDYSVSFELPTSSHSFSPQDQGNDDETDSDANPQTGRTVTFELHSGEYADQWDAGIYAPPILHVAKQIESALAYPDALLTYTIVYSNSGMGIATGVVITETVPQYTTFVPEESSVGWQCAGNRTAAGTVCAFEVGTIPAGTGKSDLLFVVRVDAILPATDIQLSNRVLIAGSETPDEPSGQNTFELITQVVTPQALEEGTEPVQSSNTGRTLYLPVSISAK